MKCIHLMMFLFWVTEGCNEAELDRLEMVSLLCMSDRTHSQLMELLPEKCGAPQNKDFDAVLAQVSVLPVLMFITS